MKHTKQAFSFIELIVVISILAIITLVAIGVNDKQKENVDNTKISSDIKTLQNSMENYYQEIGDFPMPEGNNNFFKDDTSYAHSFTGSDTFGVHGFITENTIPKKYLNYIPRDPRNGQYYAFGKTKIGGLYEIAGVTFKAGIYESLVRGNYSGELGPYSLIREFNGPNFVYDKSKDNFPYNPEQRLLVAKIHNYTGTVTINGTITNPSEILNYTLKQGDIINATIGSHAEIYISDGTVMTLGDSFMASELEITSFNFPNEDNLVTKIKLLLSDGTAWIRATSLSDDSEFDIITADTTASVRGTIFGVTKSSVNTDLIIQEGKIALKLPTGLTKDISSKDRSEAKRIHLGSETTDPSETPLTDTSVLDDGLGTINNSIQTKIKSYERNEDGEINIEIKINNIIKNKSDFLEITNGDSRTTIQNSNYSSASIFILNNSVLGNPLDSSLTNGIYELESYNFLKLRFCKIKIDNSVICTKEKHLNLTEFNQDDSAVDNDLENVGLSLNSLGIKLKVNDYLKNDNTQLKIHIGENYYHLDPEFSSGIFQTFMFNDVIREGETLPDFLDGDIQLQVYQNGTDTWNEKVVNLSYSNTELINSVPIEFTSGEDSDSSVSGGVCDNSLIVENICVENSLESEGFDLVAYAGYDAIDMDWDGGISGRENMLRESFGLSHAFGIISPICPSSNHNKCRMLPSTEEGGWPAEYSHTTKIFSVENFNNNWNSDDHLIVHNYATFSDYEIDFNGNNHIYSFSSEGEKGVFLDNDNYNGNDSYLKYDISNLGINSGDDFAIEISVRGAALKRDGKFYLFQAWNKALKLYNNKLEGFGTPITIQNLNDDNFYSIIVKSDGTILFNGEIYTSNSFNISNVLYIGSNKYKQGQWNDIINFVKIYKEN